MKKAIFTFIASGVILLSSCSNPAGNKFIGTWRRHDLKNGEILTIKKSGSSYLLHFDNVSSNAETPHIEKINGKNAIVLNDTQKAGNSPHTATITQPDPETVVEHVQSYLYHINGDSLTGEAGYVSYIKSTEHLKWQHAEWEKMPD
jgi:hypothetical protein